jgi:hypothetical protein
MATVTNRPETINRAEYQRRVRHPLGSLRKYIRLYVALEGAFVAVIYLALWFWIGLAIDYGLFKTFAVDWIQELQAVAADNSAAASWVRIALLAVLVGGLVVVVASKVVFRLFREFNDPALALVLERRFPRDLGDRLITAVEMADPKIAERYGYSQALVDQTVSDAADRVERVPVSEVFNWRRLRRLGLAALLLTVGLYLLLGLTYVGVGLATGGPSSPADYFYRFNDVGGIWVERNVLLMDSYWPRRAYLEVIRFQDTPDHPNEMRVGRDEQRPDIQVRAVQWVIADRGARDGWRPLLWKDLRGLLDASELQVSIPADWQGWVIDLDDLDARIPTGVLPVDWQGRTAGDIDKETRKEHVRRAIAAASATEAVTELLTWRDWTVDKLQLQLERNSVRRALRAEHPADLAALEAVLTRLEELAESPRMSRRLRKLTVPAKVDVFYRGKTMKVNREHDRQENNKYSIGLGELKESVRFTVRGEDYYTPYKNITLVPPPSLEFLKMDKEEPAYIYYRLQGEQTQLKGRKQIFREVPVSTTGDISTIQVPLGTNLVLTGKADRPLQGGIRMTAPAQSEERGAVLPTSDVKLQSDRQTFATAFTNIVRTVEFNYEFNDLDGVKGKRRILIRPLDDRAPEVFDVEMLAVLRKPRFKAEPGKTGGGTAADGFLITPDALLPFKGTIRDDYGLTKAGWIHEVEQVEIELLGASDFGAGSDDKRKDRLPTLVLGGNTRLRRSTLIASGLQFVPGTPSWGPLAPTYWSWVGGLIRADLAAKRSEGEQFLALPAFQRKLEDRAGEEVPLNALLQKLKEKPPATRLLSNHQLKDEEGFDFRKYLPKLKSPDPSREAQLHYLVRLSISATDNNVETGPSTGRSKTPFSYLVVSENELLIQINIEEEALRERLEKAVFKLKNGKTSMDEQVSKLSSPGADLGLVSIRVDEVRKALADAASATREIQGDYGRILRELLVNRVNKIKVADVDDKIVRPLEDIVNPNFGKFTITEDFHNKLYQGLEDDLAALKKAGENPSGQDVDKNRAAHQTLARDGRDHLDSLIEQLEAILRAMDEGISFNQLLGIAVRLEQQQRRIRDELEGFRLRTIDELLRGVIDGEGKK